MITLFLIWIAFQLITIGTDTMTVHNEIINNQFDCSYLQEEIPKAYGYILPLYAFVPESTEIANYCQK